MGAPPPYCRSSPAAVSVRWKYRAVGRRSRFISPLFLSVSFCSLPTFHLSPTLPPSSPFSPLLPLRQAGSRMPGRVLLPAGRRSGRLAGTSLLPNRPQIKEWRRARPRCPGARGARGARGAHGDPAYSRPAGVNTPVAAVPGAGGGTGTIRRRVCPIKNNESSG